MGVVVELVEALVVKAAVGAVEEKGRGKMREGWRERGKEGLDGAFGR